MKIYSIDKLCLKTNYFSSYKLLMKQILSLSLIAILCWSCGNTASREESKFETEQEDPKYYVVKESIDLLISPSTSSQRLINEKATSIIKDTVYCELDKSCKLTILENKGKYAKVKVIEPEWLTDTYIGWVPNDMLVNFGNIYPSKTVPSKIAIFNNIKTLTTELSRNGIGQLHSWRSDGMGGFMSITDYHRFGTASATNGLDNNLAYYLESNNEDYVEKLSLVLNINNAAERRDGLAKFKTVTERTFKSIKVAIPSGLIRSIEASKACSYSNQMLSATLERENNNIESWKLIIKSK